MRARQTGQLLMAVTVLIAVIGLMVIAWAFLSVSNTRSSTVNAQSAQALYAANAGLDYAAYRFRTDATAFATTCTNLNNVPQTVDASISTSFKLTTTNFAAANTTLTAAIATTTATTPISVTATGSFPAHGRMRVDSEEIVYSGAPVAGTSFTGIKRGAAGTTANTHLNAAPVKSEAQCVVRSTGTAGSASRVLESSILPGPWANFQDGSSTAIPVNTQTTVGALTTVLPTGDNVIIAAVTLQNTTATVTTIAIGNLLLRNNSTGTTLGSNLYPVLVGGTANATNNDRSTKAYFFAVRDAGAAANQTYQVRVTTAAGSGVTAGEAKILVLNNVRAAFSGTGNVASVTTAGSTIASVVTPATFLGTPAVQNAVNLVIASVQMDATSGTNGRSIAAGALRLNRNGAQISANQFLIVFRSNGNVNQEFSQLLLALDSGAPAAPTYTVTAIASNNASLEVEAKVVVMQGPAGSFIDGGSVALGTAQTTLATVAANTFPALAAGANVAVIASTEYIASAGAGGPYSIAAGTENVVYNSVNQSTSQYTHFLCNTTTSNGECDHIAGTELWLQSFAAANPRTSPSYLVRSQASNAASVNGETQTFAIQLEPIADRLEIFP